MKKWEAEECGRHRVLEHPSPAYEEPTPHTQQFSLHRKFIIRLLSSVFKSWYTFIYGCVGIVHWIEIIDVVYELTQSYTAFFCFSAQASWRMQLVFQLAYK